MGKKLDAARATNEKLNAEIERLGDEVAWLHREVEQTRLRAQLQARTITLVAPKSAAQGVGLHFLWDVNIGPFKGQAQFVGSRICLTPNLTEVVEGRFTMLPPGPDQP